MLHIIACSTTTRIKTWLQNLEWQNFISGKSNFIKNVLNYLVITCFWCSSFFFIFIYFIYLFIYFFFISPCNCWLAFWMNCIIWKNESFTFEQAHHYTYSSQRSNKSVSVHFFTNLKRVLFHWSETTWFLSFGQFYITNQLFLFFVCWYA